MTETKKRRGPETSATAIVCSSATSVYPTGYRVGEQHPSATRRQWEDYRHRVRQTAAGRWPFILARLGIDASTLENKHGPCPGCGGKDRFRFDDLDGGGTFVCSQGGGEPLAGDGYALLMHAYGWTFTTALDAVADALGIDRPGAGRRAPVPLPPRVVQPTPPADDPERAELVRAMWQTTHAIDWKADTPVRRYLSSRGLGEIVDDPPNLATLRWLPSCGYWHDGGTIGLFPAMAAVLRDASGQGVAVHRTWLASDGSGKAPVPTAKKLRSARAGATMGAAIRLYPAGSVLAVTEGIETALAVRIATGLPVWAAVSANGLAALEVPTGVHTVQIWADHDTGGAGQDAANRLADRLRNRELEVAIYLPDQPGDWLDVLNAAEVAA